MTQQKPSPNRNCASPHDLFMLAAAALTYAAATAYAACYVTCDAPRNSQESVNLHIAISPAF
jgi:hypothetical protein